MFSWAVDSYPDRLCYSVSGQSVLLVLSDVSRPVGGGVAMCMCSPGCHLCVVVSEGDTGVAVAGDMA